jgi:lysozyme
MSYIDILRPQLVIDEGRRSKIYIDTRGKWSVGIGRNLTDKGLSTAEIDFLFGNDVAEAEREARAVFITFDQLSDARKAVVVNMAFNMGQKTLEQFHGTIAAVNGGDFEEAARDMLASRWATEVGARAVRLADAMRKG